VPFAVILPTRSPKTGADRPDTSSTRCPRPPRSRPLLRRDATAHTAVVDECASPVPLVPIPKEDPAVRTPASSDARRRWRSGVLPRRGGFPSAQRVGANALRHCLSDRFRSGAVTDVSSVSIAVPLAATRIRDELGVASPCSSPRSPPARRSDAELAPRSDSASQGIRLGSRATLTMRWKPPVAAACPHPRPSLARSSPRDTEVPMDGRRRRLELRGARSEPQHPRIRDAIRVALVLIPTIRVIGVAADSDPI